MRYLGIFLNIKFLLCEIMAKRVTIMLDEDLDKKIRLLQAKEIQNTTSSVSFSTTINKILRSNLKK